MIIGITGGTSGLGKRFVEYLLNKGYKTKVLVRETSQIEDLRKWGAELIFGDITNSKSLASFIEGIDICYHFAAEVSSATKKRLISVNIEGTANICNVILEKNPNCKLVYCSSIVVKEVRFYNKFLLSNYALSKFYAEKLIDRLVRKKQLRATIIYPGYIYGPYDRNFMPMVIKMLQYGLPFLIKGGEKNAPIIYVDDLCELFYLAGINDVSLGKKYVSLRRNKLGIHDFLNIIASKKNYPFPKKIYPKLPLVIYAIILDKFYKLFSINSTPKINLRVINALSNRANYFNDKAVQELGWDQKISIPDGVEKALTWQSKNIQL